jgi:hypothetical protein
LLTKVNQKEHKFNPKVNHFLQIISPNRKAPGFRNRWDLRLQHNVLACAFCKNTGDDFWL